ncbi:BH3 interacting domain death agonist isoform X2 [Paralichthys olivaceus]|uniref:BH3 interacting domain death agonist isoform X2 n=1 Tax=Paralichthys olivaceus TaxID=8255 RepID=UPI0037510B85
MRHDAFTPPRRRKRKLQLFGSLGSMNGASLIDTTYSQEVNSFPARDTNAEWVASSMDNLCMDVTGGSSVALVILAFLQADCRDSEFRKELHSLGNEFKLTRDINCNAPSIDQLEDGDLETDGHLPGGVSVSLQDIQPSVELQWPRNDEAVANIQQVAEGLREIAAQLEESVLAQATSNLRRNISDSPSEWKNHLTLEVDRIMRHGIGLEHLPQERVFMALTLTLVKGVCEQAPQLLRSLFYAALQYITPARAR